MSLRGVAGNQYGPYDQHQHQQGPPPNQQQYRPPNQYSYPQQPAPQQQQQYGAPPPRQYGPGPPAPPNLYPGAMTPYRPPPPRSDPPPPTGGIFSKIKSSLSAFGHSLVDTPSPPSSPNPSSGQYRPPPPRSGPPPFGPPPPRQQMSGQYRGPAEEERVGLLGKIKSIFSNDDSDVLPPPPPRRPPGYPPQFQPRPPSAPIDPPLAPSAPMQQRQQFNYPPPPPPQQQQQQQQQGYQSSPPASQQQQGYQSIPPASQQQYAAPPMASFAPMTPLSPNPPIQQQQNPQIQDLGYAVYGFPPPPAEEPQAPPMPSDPQVFVVEDCIVMILKPVEFQRKKSELTRGGGANLQVFTNFEGTLTRFKTDDGAPAYTTAELLEESSALAPSAVAALRGLAQDFDGRTNSDDSEDDASFERYTSQCQRIICSEGNLHIASVAPAVRAMLPFMPLRDGWRGLLEALTSKGVPAYIFSSGYADVVAQTIIQAAALENTGLPNNVRIISNFFRTAPDGTVRAFSQPVVHERNKLASTAAALMNMPLPQRSNALVLGSHEQDLRLTEGADATTVLSVGHLELTEDLARSLPVALQSFDAVVLGDSSLQFTRNLVDDILGLAGEVKESRRDGSSLFERHGNVIDSLFQ